MVSPFSFTEQTNNYQKCKEPIYGWGDSYVVGSLPGIYKVKREGRSTGKGERERTFSPADGGGNGRLDVLELGRRRREEGGGEEGKGGEGEEGRGKEESGEKGRGRGRGKGEEGKEKGKGRERMGRAEGEGDQRDELPQDYTLVLE